MSVNTHKQLLFSIGKTCKHYKEISRISGADFNVFNILKVTDDEVKHSAFLAELLNPKGSHGQGDIFLKLFVKILEIEDFHSETASLEVEKYIGTVTETTGGLIDIFIDDKNGNTITIENKIYADDQDNQLIRYHNFKPQHLHYLTLDGKKAGKKSTCNEIHNKMLICPEHYQVISYKYHVLKWLDQCQKEAVSMPLLREGIAHYINLIKHLTGTTTNNAMSKEIVELVTENPVNLQNAKELINSWNDVKADIQWKFWEALVNELQRLGIIFKNDEKTVTHEKTLKYYIGREKRFGLWTCIHEKDDITIHWGCELNYSAIYYGFTLEKNGKGHISNDPNNENYRNIILACDTSFKTDSPGWLGWKFTVPELNFNQFDSEAIFNLANKAELDKTVQAIACKAYSDILFVSEKLKELEGTNNS